MAQIDVYKRQAENCGITRQGVRDAIKRAEEILFDMESKLGVEQKTKLFLDSVDKIGSIAKDIVIYNDQYTRDNRIRNMANKINDLLDKID